MKINKMLYLEAEVVEAVKEPLSALVNRLLKEHLNKDWLDNATVAELKAEQECIKLEKELKKKQKELRKNAISK